MEPTLQVVISQVSILAILGLTGFLAARFNIIDNSIRHGISKIIFEITSPLLVLFTISNLQLTSEIVKNSGIVLILSYIALGLLYASGYLGATAMRLKSTTRSIYIAHATFGNIVFLGFPLLNELFPGGEILLYAALFQVASNSLQWTLGVQLLSAPKNTNYKNFFLNIFNPNTIALLLGLVIISTEIKIPPILDKSLGGLGRTTIYISMLYIGSMLVMLKFYEVIKKIHIFVLSLTKLIIVPLILILLLNHIPFNLTFTAKAAIILESAMPCMVAIVVMAKYYDNDDKLATENLLVSTFLSILTLPFIYILLIKYTQ